MKTFGIDLGTTNSALSMCDTETGVSKIITLKNGKNTLPSCVMLNEDGTFIIGSEAYEKRYLPCTKYSVKRVMGSNDIVKLSNGMLSVDLTPEQVSAEILKELVKQGEELLGSNTVKDVTITVPADFNEKQRKATKVAGELAGLNVISIINEPTSASLLYGLNESRNNETILVYDLGGGTFDITVLNVIKNIRTFPLLNLNINNEYNKTMIDIVSNEGDPFLGGDNIDSDVLNSFIKKFVENYSEEIETKDGIPKQWSKEYLEELKLQVEKMKKSGRSSIDIIYDGKNNVVSLTKEEMLESYKPVFNKTLNLVNKCVTKCDAKSISKLVLVGGSTKSSIIRDLLRQEFPNVEMLTAFDPDESVALGASINSSIVLDSNDTLSFNDVVNKSVGVLTAQETRGVSKTVYEKLILKDTQLPISKTAVYTNSVDGQDTFKIKIIQGESNIISDNLLIGELEVTGMPKVNAGGLIIKVTFTADLNGLLTVKAEVNGKEFVTKINSLSEEGERLNKGTDSDLLEDKKYKKWKESLINKGATFDMLEEFEIRYRNGEGLELKKELESRIEEKGNDLQIIE